MRRWNGWGDASYEMTLDAPALAFLRERIGSGSPPRDAALESVLSGIAPGRLEGAGYASDPEARLRHARGQSFPDWLALRSGRVGRLPDAVVAPDSFDALRAALADALRRGAVVVPYGGGTSVVGHLTPPEGERPVLSLSLERMTRLLELDPVDRLARFEAGVSGPLLERQLGAQGWRLGHYPQSFQYSTLGGWVAARSSGQQSRLYGRIEQLFHGGRLLTPRGEWRVGGHPASAAGPDLRHLVLGSEGRLGVLGEASVRIVPLPQREDFHVAFLADWTQGLAAVRALAQEGPPLSMLRLSNALETDTQLRLAGRPQAVAWLRRYLALRGLGGAPVMLTFGLTGSAPAVTRWRRQTLAMLRAAGALHVGRALGRAWAAKRFTSPYLRNTLWELGYGADTVETAVSWSGASALMRAIERAATQAAAEDGERMLAFTHLSHVYSDGCSLYSTFVFRLADDPERSLARWKALKRAVSEAIVAAGGTISHQHGVGRDHAPYLAAEKGETGLNLLRAVCREIDPDGRMNPGSLLEP
jgi:FAD/FMN-containing dehydrogenases